MYPVHSAGGIYEGIQHFQHYINTTLNCSLRRAKGVGKVFQHLPNVGKKMIEKEDLEIFIKDEGLITWAECDSAIVGIVSRCHLIGKN